MKTSLIALIVALIFISCQNLTIAPDETGIVEGKVMIGPLCGNISSVVENSNPCGYTDEQLNLIYGKYKVALTGNVDGQAISKEYVLTKTGLFSFEVPVGSYKIEIVLPQGSTNSQALIGSKNSYVQSVSVMKNQVSRLEFSIDTGIR